MIRQRGYSSNILVEYAISIYLHQIVWSNLYPRICAEPTSTRHSGVSGGAYTTAPHSHAQVVCPPRWLQLHGTCPTSTLPGLSL